MNAFGEKLLRARTHTCTRHKRIFPFHWRKIGVEITLSILSPTHRSASAVEWHGKALFSLFCSSSIVHCTSSYRFLSSPRHRSVFCDSRRNVSRWWHSSRPTNLRDPNVNATVPVRLIQSIKTRRLFSCQNFFCGDNEILIFKHFHSVTERNSLQQHRVRWTLDVNSRCLLFGMKALLCREFCFRLFKALNLTRSYRTLLISAIGLKVAKAMEPCRWIKRRRWEIDDKRQSLRSRRKFYNLP